MREKRAVTGTGQETAGEAAEHPLAHPCMAVGPGHEEVRTILPYLVNLLFFLERVEDSSERRNAVPAEPGGHIIDPPMSRVPTGVTLSLPVRAELSDRRLGRECPTDPVKMERPPLLRHARGERQQDTGDPPN